MEICGHVQGQAARKYAGFTYRVPELTEVTMRSLDPYRLRYAEEYPRSIGRPSTPTLKTVDLADYKLLVRRSPGRAKVEVYLTPNRFTAAREPRLVWEGYFDGGLEVPHEYTDEALREAFRAI